VPTSSTPDETPSQDQTPTPRSFDLTLTADEMGPRQLAGLRQGWVEMKADDGTVYKLDVGAGLGNPGMWFSIQKPGQKGATYFSASVVELVEGFIKEYETSQAVRAWRDADKAEGKP